MSWTKQLSVMIMDTKQHWKRSLLKGLLAVSSILLITSSRFILHSFPLIYHASLFYLFVVIVLALLLGRAIALLAAITAFICLDFFYMAPFYTLAVNQFDDMLSLLLFLLIAISVCFLASEIRNRYYKTRMKLVLQERKSVEDAIKHNHYIYILYEIMKKTSREKTLKAQLSIITQAIAENLESSGVYGCVLFLPDKENCALAEASWPPSIEMMKLLDGPDVRRAAQMVMANNLDISFAIESISHSGKRRDYIRRVVAQTSRLGLATQHYAYLMPLPLIHGNPAVLLLIVDQHVRVSDFAFEQDGEQKQANIQIGFLWQCIEHIVTLVEKARLQDEKLNFKLIKWVSHGIRTPLTAFLWETDKALNLVQNEGTANDKIYASLESIRDSAKRLDHFVDDFLDMTRAKGGILKPHKSFCFIDELVDETLKGMQSVIADRLIEKNIPDDLPPLELDPNQIGHVLTNLIENAVRYAPSSPIEINAQIQGNYMHISVADRGRGITPDEKRHIFDEFYQGRAASSRGKGIGLSTCKALVEAHEGKIDVEDRDGGGTIFYFTLPLSEQKE